MEKACHNVSRLSNGLHLYSPRFEIILFLLWFLVQYILFILYIDSSERYTFSEKRKCKKITYICEDWLGIDSIYYYHIFIYIFICRTADTYITRFRC
jgi:hypothetical protein